MPTALPVSLQERLEFGSDAWIIEGHRYLESRLDELKSAASVEGPLSMCEVYTDAPHHLGLPDDTVTITLRVNSAGFEFIRGDSDDVDMKVRADYNKAQELITTVYSGETARRSRAERELFHRYGQDVFDAKGQVSLTPRLAKLLEGLHDHLARRTVLNPDGDHRLRHLGLDIKREELDSAGYTILERAISDEFADELKVAVAASIDATPGPASARLLQRGRMFEEAALHPWVLALQAHLVGPGFLLFTSIGLRKEPGQVLHTIHTDYPLIAEPYPTHCLVSTTIWALEDFDEDAGPTLVVPGSFREGRSPAAEGEHRFVPIHMPKGSIAMWHGATWHSSKVRNAPGERVTLHNTYSRIYVRSADSYLDIDRTILANNPPQMATLCGFDDLFEKSTDAGPYAEGQAYAEKHYMSNALPAPLRLRG